MAPRYNTPPEVVQVFLDAGADVEARTEFGLTPLMRAAMFNENPEMVLALLDGRKRSSGT